MKVVHVITDLERGGAEGALARLAMCLKPQTTQTVVSLRGRGVWADPLEASGIPVRCMEMGRHGLNPMDWQRAVQVLRSERADVVQTWMYHADLVGGIAARAAGAGAVAWGIRNLTLPRATSRASTRLVRRLSAWLSNSIPDAIVCCSEAAAELHRQIGYSDRRIVVIPNGIDTAHFRPDQSMRKPLRSKWGVNGDLPVIGMVARWDAQKDHSTLLRALQIVNRDGLAFRCILVGPGIDETNLKLTEMVRLAGLSERIQMLGSSTEVMEIMNALDLHVLSSQGEAFPNVVAEAMACGTPCVVTDVGDAATIVGDTGLIVPAGDPMALARAIERALSQFDRTTQGPACRKRIERYFGLGAMAEAYLSLWSKLVMRKST